MEPTQQELSSIVMVLVKVKFKASVSPRLSRSSQQSKLWVERTQLSWCTWTRARESTQGYLTATLGLSRILWLALSLTLVSRTKMYMSSTSFLWLQSKACQHLPGSLSSMTQLEQLQTRLSFWPTSSVTPTTTSLVLSRSRHVFAMHIDLLLWWVSEVARMALLPSTVSLKDVILASISSDEPEWPYFYFLYN